jgi:4-amino-4-deoxy-L-arabinose transferase-like glycosyltransferase
MMTDPGTAAQTRAVLWLIAGSTLVRLVFAAATGLGMDESYMVSAGRAVGVGYFDHPPASWWLSWGAATLAGSEAAVIVRLPFIALFALSTWLMFKLGAVVADARAGFWAAAALNLSPVFGMTTGTWVLPDGPLDCALLGAALCLARAIVPDARPAWWLGAGACAGLALLAKYTAVLSIAGAFLFLLASPSHRIWLRRPGPWLAGLVALVVFAPVIIWNATHGWASFAFQGERATAFAFRPLAPLEVLGGGALFVLPWFWVPMMLLGARALARGMPAERLLAWLAAPPIIGFAAVAAWSGHRVLFHWAAPGYLMLFPLLGQAIAAHLGSAWVRRGMAGTAALVLAAMAVISLQTRFDLLGPALSGVMRKDPTSEGVDWTSLRRDLAGRGLLPPGTLVGLPNWRDGGKIARGLGPDMAVVVLHPDARQFGVAWPMAAAVGRDMLVLIAEHPERTAASLAPLFARMERLADAPVTLRGRVLRQVAVYRGEHLLRGSP